MTERPQLRDRNFIIFKDQEDDPSSPLFFVAETNGGNVIDEQDVPTIYSQEELHDLAWDLARKFQNFVPVLTFDGLEEEDRNEFYKHFVPALTTIRELDLRV